MTGILVAALTAGPARADHGTPQVVSTGPAGGNGAVDAGGGRLSSDGSRAFFTTREQLVASDTDTKVDIYVRAGGTTELVSSGPSDAGQYDPFFEDMSADGAHVAFTTRDALTADDTDISHDVYEHFGGVTVLVSTGPGSSVGSASNARFAAGGQRIFFGSSSELVSGDTDGAEDVYERAAGVTTLATPGINQCHLQNFGYYCEGAYLDDVSDDGDRIIFESGAYLAGDFDWCGEDDNEDPIGCFDLFERSGGTYRLVTTGTTTGGDDYGQSFVMASDDASYVLFETYEALQPTDTDFAVDAYVWHAGATTHVSAKPGGGSSNGDVGYNALISSDGLRTFFTTQDALLPEDGDGFIDVYEYSGGALKLVSTAPGAGNGASHATLRKISADGSRVFFESYEQLVAADTDLRSDVYERIHASSTHLVSPGAGAFNASLDDVSADGRRAVFETGESLDAADADSSVDVYSVTAPAGYARPKGATPIAASLVLAYRACAASNRTHGPPLAFGSCNPPDRLSPNLTVGTPDANSNQARFAGLVTMYVGLGNPSTPADEADVAIGVDMTDVRRASDLADYTGEVQLRLPLRLTDRSGAERMTVTDSALGVTVPCTATADPAIGAHCSVTTTADTVVPGSAPEGGRSIWGLGQLQVFDGGPDGVAATQDNSLFAVQGVFVP